VSWKEKLAKCCACRRKYFYLSHAKRTYRHGTFCPICTQARRSETANASTKNLRKNSEDKLHQLAAKRFRKEILNDSQWANNSILKNRMAQYLTEKIELDTDLSAVYFAEKRTGVSAKWISWAKNRNAIETAARGLDHGRI
jgi:hypothetical protein